MISLRFVALENKLVVYREFRTLVARTGNFSETVDRGTACPSNSTPTGFQSSKHAYN